MKREQYQAHLHSLIAEGRCAHCGVAATDVDIAIPALARRPIFHMLAKVGATGLTSCAECLELGKQMEAQTLGKKRRAIHHRLSIRYGKVLELPAWSAEELDDLGYNLRTDVEAGQRRRRAVEQRLTWPRLHSAG